MASVRPCCTYRFSQSETQEAEEHKHLQHGYGCKTRTKSVTRNLHKNPKEEGCTYMEGVTGFAGWFEKNGEDVATVLNIEVYIDG